MEIPVGIKSRVETESSDVEFERSNLWDGRVVRWMKRQQRCCGVSLVLGALSSITFLSSIAALYLPENKPHMKATIICASISGTILGLSIGGCLYYTCIRKKPETIPLTRRG
jgi:hypothetical protein